METWNSSVICHKSHFLSLKEMFPLSCMCQATSVGSDSATLWTVASQTLLSVGFSRRYWSGLPCPPPRDLQDWLTKRNPARLTEYLSILWKP